ncbi:bifunctional DNA-formamidopyrimidine glycosylase/DNA-(apurinic or apyrimidinic site) lyase [Mycoplasma sp. 2704]|uniref:bifunctional DNA-formamidopyrimidine glycosylase/DNA-(apurinic or apyrimidinic site) lyase n=1 Tax=Mycoplasma sp. 2704 TaxID=3108529 RepID=UPI002B1D0BF8|nr:bifunctional DNA-formamidopyrimidine glycosylase/DNA-(apurinic or apyrimidinic site) lyase [Mycoplasma sp. 2704]MEA4134200.1 bifunctional DNA-formamidopyrimidine glycosylase/DNA-(apurinic or apyrimidinic site) lyase [Mycoplasma sp. 2704]
MPEYPEVTIITEQLNKKILNKTIENVQINVSKIIKNVPLDEFVKSVTDKKIIQIQNYGKFITIYLDDNSKMVIHLRMSGMFYVVEQQHLADLKKMVNHIIVEFYLSDNLCFVFVDPRMFGSIEYFANTDKRSVYEIKKLAKLPKDVDVDALYEKLQRKNISIKAALLDQQLVLGIGNIYADESLFASKIYPMTKCNKLTKEQLKELLKNVQIIMDDSIKAGGSTVHTYASVNGVVGHYQNYLRVYSRANKRCLVCKEGIVQKVKLDFKPNGRGTSFCPVCQKEQ